MKDTDGLGKIQHGFGVLALIFIGWWISSSSSPPSFVLHGSASISISIYFQFIDLYQRDNLHLHA